MSAHASLKIRHFGNYKSRKAYVDPMSRKAIGETNALAEKHIVAGEPTRIRQHARGFAFGKLKQSPQ